MQPNITNTAIESKLLLERGVAFFKDTFFKLPLSTSILPIDQVISWRETVSEIIWVLTKKVTWKNQLSLEEKSFNCLGGNNPFHILNFCMRHIINSHYIDLCYLL